ncbi:MAG: penicillin-binding protein activator [Pseudohongiellaceae bacterium]
MTNLDPNAALKISSRGANITLACFIAILLTACASSPQQTIKDTSTEQQSTSQEIEELLAAANNLEGAAAYAPVIQAIELLIAEEDYARAARVARSLDVQQLPEPTLINRYTLSQARIAIANENLELAEEILTNSLELAVPTPEHLLLLGEMLLNQGRPAEAFTIYTTERSISAALEDKQELHNFTWKTLEKINTNQLSTLARNANSYSNRGWLELAKAVADQELSIEGQLDAIEQWQRVWSSHDAVALLPTQLIQLRQNWELRPRRVAVILPLQDQAGKAIEEGFLSAYYHSLEQGRDAPQISFYDSSDTNNIYPIYDDAVDAGADLIIGPLKKELVEQLHRLPSLPLPTLALNYVADSENEPPADFYQFGLAPENEIHQAVKLAADFGYQNAAIILPSGEDYLRLNNIFQAAWTESGGSVVSQATFDGDSNYGELIKQAMAIDASETRAEKIEDLLPRNTIEFIPRRRQDIDFIYLIANPRQGRQIKPTLAFYFAEDLPVIAYPSIFDGSSEPDSNRDLDGVVLLDSPWLLETSDPVKLLAAKNLRTTAGPLKRLRSLGVDSYRLHDRLGQFSASEITALSGTTGVLSVKENGEVQRQLLTAIFKEGLPETVSQSSLTQSSKPSQ